MTQPPPPKPLFYVTSKCVALYLKPIIRIQLYLRCPTFQTIHRAQNFRVANLKIRPENFEIDGTLFQFGILRHYLFGNVPESTTLKNAAGGDRHDIDRYGLPILAQNVQQLPTDAQYIEQLEQQAFRMERNGPRALPRRELTEDDVKSHRLEIERKRLRVRSYELRMRNQKPPFQHFVELAMTSREEKKCEYVTYEKTLQEIKDYVLQKIFGIDAKVLFGNLQIGKGNFFQNLTWIIQNPQPVIQMNPVMQAQMAAQNFPIPGFVPEVPPVFQLRPRVADVVPLLKLQAESVQVNRLVVTGNLENTLASLKPILCEIPLKELKVSAQPFPDDPVVRTAQFLSIVGSPRVTEIQHLQNSRVHFDQLVDDEQEFHAFVRMMEEAETMRYYSFGFSELEDVKKSLERFRSFPGAEHEDFTEISVPKRFTIPLNNQKELNIYVKETSIEDTTYCDKPLIVKIKV
ncbi:hypothetical protein CRE_12008 [Caenorhabditis remanei]|uniref:Uncharacterized protein n=1 Tax=Caenorhabditis remanei TaxID=31234 RepID=E3MPP7_CAERE|nr:hypothetical protein CRE_12008 [Caenorhabditis remanei]